jgi:tetratricopeptide (TPR) repeat protein
VKAEGRRQKAEVVVGKIVLAVLTSAFCLLPSAFGESEEFTKAVFFGQKYFAMKDYTAAYAQFAKADQLQPDVAGVLYDMALTLAKAGRVSEAQTKVDRYNQLYPNGAEKPLIAKLQLELEFQRELQKKREVEEQYAELFSRGRFLYQKGDLDAAMRLFQEAEQKRPTDAAAVFNQAVILEKRGDFAKAAERFHRYADLEADAPQKAAVDQRIMTLESEIEDMKTKIVCSFCGLRLPIGAMWCPRCWHGPYANVHSCPEGGTATRATFYADERFARNDTLSCLVEPLRYTPAKQKLIQNARKAEGWTYSGDIINGPGLVQGADYLEKAGILVYAAHKAGELWLLDREDLVIDGQKYTSRYTFDAQNRVARQEVAYVNAAACGHLIDVAADYTYSGDALAGVKIKGGYDGVATEGSPHVEWQAATTYAYDAGRLMKEELAVTSFTKEYKEKPQGNERDEVASLYPTMRVKRPIENVARVGDLCAKSGTTVVGNPIDLRPFYAMSPNLAMLLPFGVTKATVTFTYPAK